MIRLSQKLKADDIESPCRLALYTLRQPRLSSTSFRRIWFRGIVQRAFLRNQIGAILVAAVRGRFLTPYLFLGTLLGNSPLEPDRRNGTTFSFSLWRWYGEGDSSSRGSSSAKSSCFCSSGESQERLKGAGLCVPLTVYVCAGSSEGDKWVVIFLVSSAHAAFGSICFLRCPRKRRERRTDRLAAAGIAYPMLYRSTR